METWAFRMEDSQIAPARARQLLGLCSTASSSGPAFMGSRTAADAALITFP